MLTFEYEQPLQISGVIINEVMLKHLSYIQTGSSFIVDANYRHHNNEGINDYINDIAGIINHLLGDLIEADTEDKPKVIEQIEIAYMLRTTFEKLKLPDELLTEKP